MRSTTLARLRFCRAVSIGEKPVACPVLRDLWAWEIEQMKFPLLDTPPAVETDVIAELRQMREQLASMNAELMVARRNASGGNVVRLAATDSRAAE
jgi:hypothetical protein